MKIKIHTLALELNVSENTLIQWLTRKGYPGARGQDWLTPHLAKLARKELRSRVSSYASLRLERERTSHERFTASLPLPLELKRELEDQAVSREDYLTAQPSPYSRQKHARQVDSSHLQAEVNRSEMTPVRTPQPDPQSIVPTYVGRHVHPVDSDSQGDSDLMRRERARAELLLRRLEEQRVYHEERYHELRRRYERTVGERTQLRQTLYSMGQNQETLDLTCRELSQELDQTRREVNDLKRDLKAQEKMSSAIDQVTQQKQAWRAKALALEERVQTNQQLSVQLKELGMESLESQVRLFQTLLATPESAGQLFHSIKMVEHDEVKSMVERWVVPTCAHPQCHQINQLYRKLSLRVDRPSQCQVCGGQNEVRWFKRMTASCERSHIRRFLLVGAEEVHDRIRELSEGQAVDFRLISSRDESSDQRIYSRLENCDLLVSWPHDPLSTKVGDQYRSIAHRAGAPSLEIPGTQIELGKLTRFILNWVNRTGGRP